MRLVRDSITNGKKDRQNNTVNIQISELPERGPQGFKTPKEYRKFIDTCEKVIRKSVEYRQYIKFLKSNMDMSKCAVLRGLKNTDGKKYSIEIHHEPFTLFDIVEAVLTKRREHGEPINPLNIADEVMALHYEGKVGLIPLASTMHELVHNDRIFIPLQFIYHRYDAFFNEYDLYINSMTQDKIKAKAEFSLRCEDVVSDALDVSFTYIECDGFQFPEIPDEWKNVMSMNNPIDLDVDIS